jgi:hypothetical protein
MEQKEPIKIDLEELIFGRLNVYNILKITLVK